jgi:hypothetical protein
MDYTGVGECNFPNFSIANDAIVGSVVASPSSLSPGMVLLQWDFELAVGEVVDIWRSTVNDLSTATEVAQTRDTYYLDGPLTAGTYYYWTRRAFPGSASYGNWDYTEYAGQSVAVPAQSLVMSPSNPLTPGQISMIIGTPLPIQTCDAIDDGNATWSVLSGAGVTIQLNIQNQNQGTGCIQVNVPAGVTAVVQCVVDSGSWDLSSYKYLRLWIDTVTAGVFGAIHAYFGQTTYNEQSTALTANINQWIQNVWTISGIAAGSRSAVTIFAISIANTGSNPGIFLIDNIFADPGIPTQVVGFDGVNTFSIYPPSGTYFIASTDTAALFASADTEETHTGDTTMTKVKEIQIKTPGTLSISFDIKNSNAGGATTGQVYKNGVALGTSQGVTGTTYTTYTETLGPFTAGDLIQLYIKTGAAVNTAYARNFRLSGYKTNLGAFSDYVINVN